MKSETDTKDDISNLILALNQVSSDMSLVRNSQWFVFKNLRKLRGKTIRTNNGAKKLS